MTGRNKIEFWVAFELTILKYTEKEFLIYYLCNKYDMTFSS